MRFSAPAALSRQSDPGQEYTVKISVNGDDVTVTEGSTVAALLNQLGIETRYVAVEVNLDIVPRAEHVSRVLHDGDELEIVTMVGGG